MSGHNQHIIQKVIFDLQMTDQSTAFERQQAISHWFREQAQPALAQLFDKMISPAEVAQIDQLTIDLGNIKPEQINENLLEQLIDQLTIVLQERLDGFGTNHHIDGQAQSLQRYTFQQWLYFLEKGYLPTHVLSERKEESFWQAILQQLKQDNQSVDQLKQLLLSSVTAKKRLVFSCTIEQQRQLLSIISGKDQKPLSDAWTALEKWLSEEKSPQREFLPQQLQASLGTRNWEVLTWLFSWEQSLRYAQQWHEIVAAFLLEAWRDSPLATQPDKKSTPILDWPEALKSVQASWQQMVAKSHISSTETSSKAVGEVSKSPPEDTTKLEGKIVSKQSLSTDQAKPDSAPKPVKDQAITSAKTEENTATTPADTPSSPNKDKETSSQRAVPAEDSNTPPPTEASQTDAANSNISTKEQESAAHADENTQPPLDQLLKEQDYQPTDFSTSTGDYFYVDAAGVVIVHPYLATLFKALELWKEEAFASDHAQQRAVYLVHYLAKGDVEAREEEMILAKLLCGRPFELPLEPIELDDSEKAEADNMLAAVIQNWGALGKASPEGLREGFFDREAKLEKKETVWQLTIERKAQDILLGKLPWGLSIIKLPWLKELVKVGW